MVRCAAAGFNREEHLSCFAPSRCISLYPLAAYGRLESDHYITTATMPAYDIGRGVMASGYELCT
jgi:hypothetical protein